MSRRTEQVAEEIQRHISELLIREVQDPRIGFATVTSVEMSADLQHAVVHISIMGSEDEERESLRALQKAAGFMRTQIGRRMRLRHVPQLRFVPDRSAKHAIRISSLLDEVLPTDAAAEDHDSPPTRDR